MLGNRGQKIEGVENLIITAHAGEKTQLHAEHGVARAIRVACAVQHLAVIGNLNHSRQREGAAGNVLDTGGKLYTRRA